MRYAICNELFDGIDPARFCALVAGLGYGGVELAPFTLGPEPTRLPPVERTRWRNLLAEHGLHCVGLHWLLAGTDGLHWASDERQQRAETARHLSGLAELCRDLGGGVMVLGSPRQRMLKPGVSPGRAMDFAQDTIRAVVPALESCGVRLAIEPLGPEETDFLNTAHEAVQLIRRVDSPAVGLQLDMKAMATEREPPDVLIARHARDLVHFHANDPNRLGPGMGKFPVQPCLAALRAAGYNGWISVEAFDSSPGAERIAAESISCLRAAASAG